MGNKDDAKPTSPAGLEERSSGTTQNNDDDDNTDGESGRPNAPTQSGKARQATMGPMYEDPKKSSSHGGGNYHEVHPDKNEPLNATSNPGITNDSAMMTVSLAEPHKGVPEGDFETAVKDGIHFETDGGGKSGGSGDEVAAYKEDPDAVGTQGTEEGRVGQQLLQEIYIEEAATLPNRAFATITDHNTNAPPQRSAVIDNSYDQDEIVPGFMFVPGPDYTGMGIHTGYNSASDDDNNINDGNVVIIQGFLPEDDPTRSSRRMSSAESTRERIQRLIDNAVTLDDSAVRPIPIEEVADLEGGNVDEEIKSSNRRWFLPEFVPSCIIILAIVLPLSLRGKSGHSAKDTTSMLSDDVCLPGGVDVRFELAKSILSSITSPDLLEDESTPQGKAIRWIVCHDSISVQLLGNQDPSTGHLPKQNHGFIVSGVSGEAQVTRRYILATFYFASSQDSPWKDSLNFLSPDLHECNWHVNYTRHNFPFGDFDPLGVICVTDSDTIQLIDFDDEDHPVRYLDINFRIENNLNGQLPPEIGYLVGCRRFMVENHVRLAGPLPQTMGNMTSLYSVALLFNGPNFGGELPSGLFQLKNVHTIHIQHNFGKQWSLPANVQVHVDTQLERLLLIESSFTGNIPSWIAQLSQLQTLDLSGNTFQGASLEAIGNLSSLKYLNLRENNFTETIPSSFGQLTNLEALILGKNKLHGVLPASIGNLRALKIIDVGSNDLTSVIPSSFANLESLKYLVLESNKFNGTVDVLESMKNSTVLLIRSNSFSGALPDGLFSEISENIVIDVGHNSFTGDLPASFANMSNLVSFIGAKNSFAENVTEPSVCDKTALLVMDCASCECCEVCCDEERSDVCNYQEDVHTLLGFDCGSWYKSCLPVADYFANSSSALTEKDYY